MQLRGLTVFQIFDPFRFDELNQIIGINFDLIPLRLGARSINSIQPYLDTSTLMFNGLFYGK